MKKICLENNIPTAKFKICSKLKQVLDFLKLCDLPIVVKADGLAAGKGVTICKSYNEVIKATNDIFNGKFKSSKKLILEEFLDGEEASYFVIADKNNFKFFYSSDHKRAFENDKGRIREVWAYSPAPIINKLVEKK